MNLSRGWLFMDKPRRFAPACLSGVLLLAWPQSSPAVWEGPSSRGIQAAEADVLPGSVQAGAPDLLLRTENASKADALAQFSRAIIAEDNADSDAALDDYQKALALDPGYTELAVKVAFELARRGDASAGVEVLKDNIKASPKAPLAYLYLSQLYSKYLGKQEMGLKYAQQALDLDPTNFASYIAVYEICQSVGDPRRALAILDRAARQPINDPQFWLQLGEFYRKSLGGSPSQEDLKKLTAIYRAALVNAGDDPVTLASVADFFAGNHQEKEAIPLYLSAIKHSPANPPEGDDTLTTIRYNLARCLVGTGKSPEAIDTLKRLIKDDPLRPEPYVLLCKLYEDSNQTEAALAICKQITMLRPSDVDNYLQNAELLIKENKVDAAIQILTDTRLKFPAEARVTYFLALALSESKQFHEALTIFDEAVQEASQGQTEMLPAQFYFDYGAAAEQCGELEKAAVLLKKSIQLDPQAAAQSYNYLGYMWVDRGMRLEEGGDLIKKALQMDPENPAYIDSLGWYYFKKGSLKEALETLKKAAALIKPADATVDEHLGDAYAATSDTAHALEYWQRAAALDKDNKEIPVKIAGARQKLVRQAPPAGSTPSTP